MPENEKPYQFEPENSEWIIFGPPQGQYVFAFDNEYDAKRVTEELNCAYEAGYDAALQPDWVV